MRFVKKRKEYLEIYSFKQKVESDLFILNYKKNEYFAVGIAVTKKVGNAVKRNKIKRRIKAFLRINQEDLNNIMAGVVIIAKPKTASADWFLIENNLNNVFNKLIKKL